MSHTTIQLPRCLTLAICSYMGIHIGFLLESSIISIKVTQEFLSSYASLKCPTQVCYHVVGRKLIKRVSENKFPK